MGICGARPTTAAPQVSRCCFAGPVVLRPVNLAIPLVRPKFPGVLLVGWPSPGRTWLILLTPVLCLRPALWVSRETLGAGWGADCSSNARHLSPDSVCGDEEAGRDLDETNAVHFCGESWQREPH